MDKKKLANTALKMIAPGKGLIAMDESNRTCCKRFDAHNVECTPETRRQYRQTLATTPGLGEYISGTILFDETLRQNLDNGTPIRDFLNKEGIIPGIKVDKGAKDLALNPGEKVTEGLDGLRERFAEYAGFGAGFAKWRAVITIGENIPSKACIKANAHALARYAALAQEAGIVPVVEPEVLLSGDHSIEQCYEATLETLTALFAEMNEQGVYLEGAILKASMVLSGKDAQDRAKPEEVARQTIECLKAAVPEKLAGVVFLSGGQSDEEAALHLDLMHKQNETLPWPLSFSYSRALQRPALELWSQDTENNVEVAQQALLFRAKMCSLASRGLYEKDMEKERPYNL